MKEVTSEDKIVELLNIVLDSNSYVLENLFELVNKEKDNKELVYLCGELTLLFIRIRHYVNDYKLGITENNKDLIDLIVDIKATYIKCSKYNICDKVIKELLNCFDMIVFKDK